MKSGFASLFSFCFKQQKMKLCCSSAPVKIPLSPLLWTNTCCSHQREGENTRGWAEDYGRNSLKQN
jgi:isopentenyldiphosphate isomerase